MTRKSTLKTAFSAPDEVHAAVGGFYAGLKRPHQYPSPPDDTDEGAYWKFGVLVAKVVLVAAVAVATYTQIPL